MKEYYSLDEIKIMAVNYLISIEDEVDASEICSFIRFMEEKEAEKAKEDKHENNVI